MDTETFDRLTRLLAGARSRRATLGVLLSAVLVNTCSPPSPRKARAARSTRSGQPS